MERIRGIRLSAVSGLLMVSAAGCATTAARPPVEVGVRPWPAGGTQGLELATDHFVVRTTLSDAVLREVLPAFLETAFAEYTRLVPPQREDVEPLPVYLFETREEWARFTRRFAPRHADTYLHIQSGGFTDFRTGAAVAFDIGRDRTLALLAHEGFHQYAARYLLAPLPPWLNEGLATQFESFELNGAYPAFTPRRNLMRTEGLREALTVSNALIPLDMLLAMDAGEAIRRTGQPVRVFYSQLWSLIVYLRDPGCPQAAGFQRLLADIGTPRFAAALAGYRSAHREAAQLSDSQVAFHHYVAADLDGFQSAYRAFAERLAR